jgi:hypothetical protein
MSPPVGRVVRSRRTVEEVTVILTNAPVMRAAGHGDAFRPHLATFRYDLDGGGPGAMIGPVHVTGQALAATVDGPPSRSVWISRAALMPPWLTRIGEWARGAPIGR